MITSSGHPDFHTQFLHKNKVVQHHSGGHGDVLAIRHTLSVALHNLLVLKNFLGRLLHFRIHLPKPAPRRGVVASVTMAVDIDQLEGAVVADAQTACGITDREAWLWL